MLYNLILLISTILNTPDKGHLMVYEIKTNHPIETVIKNIDRLLPGDGDGSTIENALPAIKSVDTEVTLYLRPKAGYYKFTAKLVQQMPRVDGFTKTLEVWKKNDGLIFRSYVDLHVRESRFPLRFINPIKRRISDEIECLILNKEKEALIELLKE